MSAFIIGSLLLFAPMEERPPFYYQGNLAGYLDGIYSITFAAYRSPTGGSPIWSETHPSVEVTNGRFEVRFTDYTPLPEGFWDEDIWLETSVGGNVLSREHWLRITRTSMKGFLYEYKTASAGYIVCSSGYQVLGGGMWCGGAGGTESGDTRWWSSYPWSNTSWSGYFANCSSGPDIYIMCFKWTATGLSESEDKNPSSELRSYPNPFAYKASVEYTVTKPGPVSLKVYDTTGRLVKTLVDKKMEEGSYMASWDGKGENGRELPSGTYFCIVKIDGTSETKTIYIK